MRENEHCKYAIFAAKELNEELL